MSAITREMLQRAEHVRVLYVEYQRILREPVKAGARVAPGCDALLDSAALDTEIPAFTIDLSRFGAKWIAEMKTLLRSSSDNRSIRLKLFRAHLDDFSVTASAALTAHTRSMMRVDNWQRAQTFLTRSALLRVGVWRLRLAGWMFLVRLPQAEHVAERSVDMLQDFLSAIRPIAAVIPIR